MINSTKRSDILVFNCYLCHVRYLLTCYVYSTKIGEISDISKCFENFVSQALGVLTRIYAAELRVTTVKTSDSLIIELNNHSKAILDKYKDVAFEDDKVLPVITNQKMNDYLKELAELAGIDEPVRQTYYRGNERIDEVTPKYALLGTHAGRRTFICNALALGIPPQVVMKWTGHSDYKAMKPYIDIADDIKANAMSKFNQL